MPSGKTHDVITILLAAPTFAGVWGLTGSPVLAVVATATMLFGGLMFGPDLDIASRQYSRWGVFRFLWWPYRLVFRHRSRWSHGILFGTLIRVIYFTVMIGLLILGGAYLRASLLAEAPPSEGEVMQALRVIEAHVRQAIGIRVVWAAFGGLWWGAASHTLADVGWSMLRKGSEIF